MLMAALPWSSALFILSTKSLPMKPLVKAPIMPLFNTLSAFSSAFLGSLSCFFPKSNIIFLHVEIFDIVILLPYMDDTGETHSDTRPMVLSFLIGNLKDMIGFFQK